MLTLTALYSASNMNCEFTEYHFFFKTFLKISLLLD